MSQRARFLAREHPVARRLGISLRRPLAGAVGLRPPRSDHTSYDLALIGEAARGSLCSVEIGVAEGVSAWHIRAAMDARGTLTAIDPFDRGGFGFSLLRTTARRTLWNVSGSVVWLRTTGLEASRRWTEPIDFLNVDGVNDFEGLVAECRAWLPHVAPGGRVILRTEAREPSARALTLPEWCEFQGLLRPLKRGEGIVVMRQPDLAIAG